MLKGMITGLVFIILICLTLSSLADAWSDKNKKIIVGGDNNFPPYEFSDKDGKPSGYNVDISNAIADVMGIDIEIRLGNWDDMIDAINNGEVDILQGIVPSDERKKRYSFSSPHAITHHSLFARKGTPAPESLQDLNNKEVMVQHKSIMHEFLLENQVDAIIFPVTTHVEALRILSSGKHDYALVANLPGLYLGKEFGLSNLVLVGRPFTSQNYGYGVLKGNESLVAQFSEGLAILKNTGKQQEIYDKWLGVLEKDNVSAWPFLGWTAIGLSALLLVITGGVVIWNRTLRSQVNKRTVELHQHQQQLIQADKMASLGVLVSGVAHEINNPTGLLLLNLPLVNDTWRDSQTILEQHYQNHGDFTLAGLKYSRLRDELPMVFDEMTGGAMRIKRIVEDLKDFARQDEVAENKLTDINNIVETAIRLVDTTIRKSTHHFVTSFDKNLPLINVDAQRIEQIVINLILNACQALTNLGQKVEVTTQYNKQDNKITVTVRDDGSGIKEEYLTRLTDPFFTTKREQGGTGLGLSVSAGIAKTYGGQLLFYSDEDKGTKVILELPLNYSKENKNE
jgi:polar amino acid transport system substrate-binding protein